MTIEEAQRLWAQAVSSELPKRTWQYGPEGWGWYEDKTKEAAGCAHDYVEYLGFTERYRYCKRCDAKDYGTNGEGVAESLVYGSASNSIRSRP